jgi:hypothetical protein
MSLKGSSGDSLDWDGNGNLSITGDITVTNSGDFADAGGPLSGSQLYENFSTTLDTTKWITANLTQSMHTQTPDGATYNHSRFWNANGDAWTAGFWSNTKFLRSEGSSMEFDIAVNEQHPALMVGFYDGDAVLADLNTATNYQHMTEGFYIQSLDIKVYSDNNNNGTATEISEIKTNDWTSDTDAFYRCRITLKPAGGANFQVFKNGVYNTPHVEYDTTGNIKTQHRVGVCVHYDNSTDSGGRFPMFNQIGGNRSVATTIISGDGITTGKLTSTNYSSTVGSEIDLDAGTAHFGGSGGDGITFLASGDITSNQYLIERSRLFGNGNDGDVVLSDSGASVTNGEGSAADDGSLVTAATITDEQGATVCTRSGAVWTMQKDWYTNSLRLDTIYGAPVTLDTNGYRLFVKGLLDIESGTYIQNNGSDGTVGTSRTGGGVGGAGGPGGTLSAGTDGVNGGDGGTWTGGSGAHGGKGGGGGGSGGIIFISARTITNNGTIRSIGGDGGNGKASATAA